MMSCGSDVLQIGERVEGEKMGGTRGGKAHFGRDEVYVNHRMRNLELGMPRDTLQAWELSPLYSYQLTISAENDNREMERAKVIALKDWEIREVKAPIRIVLNFSN